ncbi:MAG: hypothetical protein IPM98_18035 [Lewinellaceae bacterium]|nr:hypothetical protein [Lewinellaceae bacterium]
MPNGTCPTTISRTYQAEDACGNTERCTQTITVDDKIKPAASCPSNTTVSCTNQVPAVDVSSVTTSDNCGGTVTVTHISDVPNGTCPTTISERTRPRMPAEIPNAARRPLPWRINAETDGFLPKATPVPLPLLQPVPAVDVTATPAITAVVPPRPHIGDVPSGT